MPPAPTPATLLAAVLAADPSGPLVTQYDDATGERIELSATTLDNWVAKTANLLQDGGVESGARAAVLLPPHWQTAAILLGCWSAGLSLVRGRGRRRVHRHRPGRGGARDRCRRGVRPLARADGHAAARGAGRRDRLRDRGARPRRPVRAVPPGGSRLRRGRHPFARAGGGRRDRTGHRTGHLRQGPGPDRRQRDRRRRGRAGLAAGAARRRREPGALPQPGTEQAEPTGPPPSGSPSRWASRSPASAAPTDPSPPRPTAEPAWRRPRPTAAPPNRRATRPPGRLAAAPPRRFGRHFLGYRRENVAQSARARCGQRESAVRTAQRRASAQWGEPRSGGPASMTFAGQRRSAVDRPQGNKQLLLPWAVAPGLEQQNSSARAHIVRTCRNADIEGAGAAKPGNSPGRRTAAIAPVSATATNAVVSRTADGNRSKGPNRDIMTPPSVRLITVGELTPEKSRRKVPSAVSWVFCGVS